MRGGGGSFGVVTTIELELFELAEVLRGSVVVPVERAGEVMHAWRELTQAAPPDELATLARFLRFLPIPEVPEEVRGASLVIVDAYHAGDRAQADELLAPLRALGPVNDTIRAVTMPELSRVHTDPEQPVPAARRLRSDSGAGNWISRRRSAIRLIPASVARSGSRVDPSARTLCRAP